MTLFSILTVLMLIVPMVHADQYLHNPMGSNNRLNENSRERRNANRMFDSQNNNRGGYNVGGDGQKQPGSMKFIAGSILNIQWTNQHECGGKNTNCVIIIQYMCDDNLRDGTSTSTIPDRISLGDTSSEAKRHGRHESQKHYAECKTRIRDKGLYHADQNLRGDSAIYTRQNPQGTRRGLECPEERDYYPYPMPSPWKDIAILTYNVTKCSEYQTESQNGKTKSHCAYLDDDDLDSAVRRRQKKDMTPTNEAQCNEMGDKVKWTVEPAHGIDPPECLEVPKSRDNHLGNTLPEGKGSERIPQTLKYQWTVPDISEDNCVVRIRYNISTGDYNPDETFQDHDNPKSKECVPRINIGQEYGITRETEARDRGYFIKNNPVINPFKINGEIVKELELELAINTAQIGRVFQDRTHKFAVKPRDQSIGKGKTIYNLNVSGKRGNIVQVFPATEYNFTPDPLKVEAGDYVHTQWTGALTNPQNNDGEGKAGEDKSNIITLASRTYGAKQRDGSFGNLGNNYPQSIATNRFLGFNEEYARKAAFPKKEDALSQDEGALSVDDEDEEELGDVVKDLINKDKANDEIAEILEELSDEDLLEEDDIAVKDPNARPSRRRRRRRRRRQGQNAAAKLDDAPPYVDLEPAQTETCGIFSFLCTRNNNFSNRSQKGKVIVNCAKK